MMRGGKRTRMGMSRTVRASLGVRNPRSSGTGLWRIRFFGAVFPKVVIDTRIGSGSATAMGTTQVGRANGTVYKWYQGVERVFGHRFASKSNKIPKKP